MDIVKGQEDRQFLLSKYLFFHGLDSPGLSPKPGLAWGSEVRLIYLGEFLGLCVVDDCATVAVVGLFYTGS